jgi:hypothetical protein
MGTQLKLHSLIRVRVTRLLEVQLLQWATRAGLSYSEFVRMVIVLGAREFVTRCQLWREGDDLDVRDVEDFRWHGEALPIELKPPANMVLNPTGEMPSDEEFAMAMEARRKRLEAKK